MESGEPVFRKIGVGPWEEEHPGEARPTADRYDSDLLDVGDTRNVLDRYRYWTVEAIRADLDRRGRHEFQVAIENWTHDFNIGSMVRTANAFAASTVHIVGPHKWNRKGALMTELYQHVEHHPSIVDLVESIRHQDAERAMQAGDHDDSEPTRIIAIDNVPGSVPIETYHFPKRCLMIFGAEGPGLSKKALSLADDVVYISQFGSVRSINAGAAAAVSMHAWVAQHAKV
jgi:tRNA G18 (ribose-2'-O)-methylase SpoU